MIYYAVKEDMTVYLLAIYYKKEDKNILSNEEIARIVKKECL